MTTAARLDDATPKGEVDQIPDHPILLAVQALLAGQQGDTESACQFVDKAIQAAASRPDDLHGIAPAIVSLLLESGRPVESARVARFTLLQQPNDSTLLSLHARALLSMGDAQAALQSTLAALSSKLAAHSIMSDDEEPPSPPNDLTNLWIQCLEAAEEWQEAFIERSNLLQRSADQASSADLRALAHSALRAGLPQEAAQTIQRAILLDPEDGLAYALLGEADLANGEIDAAIEHFSQATELAPHLSATWMSLSQAYLRAGQDGKAFEALRAASMAVPESADVQYALGQAYVGQNALTQALTCFRRAATLLSTHSQLITGQSIESSPYSDDTETKTSTLAGKVTLLLGQTLYQLGHLEESRQVLGAAYETTRVKAVLSDTSPTATSARSDPHLAYAYAKTLLALNDLRPALAPLKDTIESRPTEPLPYLEYARTLLAVSKPPERAAQRAIPYLQRVLEMTADTIEKKGDQSDLRSDQDAQYQEIRIEAQLLLAESLAEIGELENANQTFHQIMELPLAQQPGWRARLTHGLGRVSYRLGQYETAIAALQEAAHLDTQNASIHRWLSHTYQMLGLPDNAFQAARAALQRAPSDIDVLIWFADQCLQIHQMPGSKIGRASCRERV